MALELPGARQNPPLRPGPLLPTYTYTQAHDAHAPNKPPVRPSSQASSHVDSARRAASQTDRGTAALACRRQSLVLVLTRRHRRRSLVDSSLHLETRCSMDTRGGTPRASRVSNNHCALPGSYPSPCLPSRAPTDRRRRHPPDLEEYLLVPGARGLCRYRRLSLS